MFIDFRCDTVYMGDPQFDSWIIFDMKVVESTNK